MKILQLTAENFKKLRLVEITLDGRPLTQLTGRNGQGKTSTIDALWFLIKGQKALPDRKSDVVRRGTEKARVSGKLANGDGITFTITRTVGMDGNPPTLTIVPAVHKDAGKTPQDYLDDLFSILTFDPLKFAEMSTAEQIEELKKTAKVDLDFEAIERRQRSRLPGAARGHAGNQTARWPAGGHARGRGPAQREGGHRRYRGQAQRRRPGQQGSAAGVCGQAGVGREGRAAGRRQGAQGRGDPGARADHQAHRAAAGQGQEDARALHGRTENPEREARRGREGISGGAGRGRDRCGRLTARAAGGRAHQPGHREPRAVRQTQGRREAKQRQVDKLTRQMEAREEKKRAALGKAKIPVEGLTFDEREVKYNGIPIEMLGEGEQIRISTLIGMAANPKLRLLCIRHGEALDPDGLKQLAEMAKEHDFQIIMARVDTSGKVGVVIEDGSVIATNEE
jgi:hypothetical protein